jgi:hypothetical protein
MSTSYTLSTYRSADGETSCFKITPLLISGWVLSHEQNQMVKVLDELLESSPAYGRDLVVYRGCAIEEIVAHRPYRSFMSTSSELTEAFRFHRGCIARIAVPQGMKIMKVSPEGKGLSTLEREEYLLPRNLVFEVHHWKPSAEESLSLQFCSTSDLVTVQLHILTASQT